MTVILTISPHTLHEWCLRGHTCPHASSFLRSSQPVVLPHPGTSRKRVEKDGVSDVRPRLQRAAPSRQPDEPVARRGARPRYCRCHRSARAAPELVLRCVLLRLAGGRAAAVTPDVAVTSRLPDGSPRVSAHRTGRLPLPIFCRVSLGRRNRVYGSRRMSRNGSDSVATHEDAPSAANSHHFLHDNGTIVRVGMARQEDRSWLCKFSL